MVLFYKKKVREKAFFKASNGHYFLLGGHKDIIFVLFGDI